MTEKKGVQDLAAEVAELRAYVERLEKRIAELSDMPDKRVRDLIEAMRAVRPQITVTPPLPPTVLPPYKHPTSPQWGQPNPGFYWTRG